MDLTKVGEKFLSSVRSARSLTLLPSTSDRPEVPARAAAAAAVARVIAGLPPHQRLSLPSSSEELVSIYGIKPRGQVIEELEEDFYEEEFDPVRYVLKHIPSDENDLSYFEKQAALRLAQLDGIAERLSRHVMEHHKEMVKGMQLVMELEQDLKVANVICMNGRRHLSSSMHEVSRDLVVTSSAKKKQALLDMLPILTELRHATVMQIALNKYVEDGNYFRAFQVLSEYLQVLDGFSELSAIQEMSRGVEDWLGKTLHKLDSLLLGVCQEFEEESYITVVDAYALIGDIAGLAEKIQSFFMQEVLSETQSALKYVMQEGLDIQDVHKKRFTYSDLCLQIPESKFRQCLLRTLDALFMLLCSYYAIMSFQIHEMVPESLTSNGSHKQNGISECSVGVTHVGSGSGMSNNRAVYESVPASVVSVPTDVRVPEKCDESFLKAGSSSEVSGSSGSVSGNVQRPVCITSNDTPVSSSSTSPFDQLRKDAILFVAQTLQRGRKNLWQLTSSRLSVLLSCPGVCSTSTHQFLRNYEDLNVFILAGEAFCGSKAVELRQRVKSVCENYLATFHRQNIYALKMVLEKETWLQISPDTIQVISLAGLVGDGAPLIVDGNPPKVSILHSTKLSQQVETGNLKDGFSYWLKMGNPFTLKLTCCHKDYPSSPTISDGRTVDDNGGISLGINNQDQVNGDNSVMEDENEDLLADFIDEDSQLPSRISKPTHSRNHPAHWNADEIRAQTGSSLSLLRMMDKYARLMQKLEVVNMEFFKGICQLFQVFFYFIFETFGQRDVFLNVKAAGDSLTHRLRTALTRITQELSDELVKPHLQISLTSPGSQMNSFLQTDITPVNPTGANFGHAPNSSFGLKERCTGAETVSLVARILHRSRSHLQPMLLQNNAAMVEDFYVNLVDAVPDLKEHIHKTTARLLLNINGYVDRIANAKWELKELGLEHNGYVDLLLGEFKHYRTRLAHGGIEKQVQDLLLEYGLENVAETLIEGFSRVKRCTNEGRALMSLDHQVLINGLQHFVSTDVKPKMQMVETFIKAYYLPETEYVYWARSHPEYTKNQIIGLINLVAAMKSWKRKTRLDMLEKIESM